MKNKQKHGARFSDASTTKDIKAEWWGEDDVVTIKKFSYGQQQDIAGKSLKISASIDDVRTDVNMQTINKETLLMGIKSWTFTDPSGKPMAVTKQGVFKLNPEDAEFILAEIQEYNGTVRVTAGQVLDAENLYKDELAKGEDADMDLLPRMKKNWEKAEERYAEQQEKFQETDTST